MKVATTLLALLVAAAAVSTATAAVELVTVGHTAAGTVSKPHVTSPSGSFSFFSGVNFTTTYDADNTTTQTLRLEFENQDTNAVVNVSALPATVHADDGATGYIINWESIDIVNSLSTGFDEDANNETLGDGLWYVSVFMDDNGTETSALNFYNFTVDHQGVVCDDDVATTCNITVAAATDTVSRESYNDEKHKVKVLHWVVGALCFGILAAYAAGYFMSHRGKSNYSIGST